MTRQQRDVRNCTTAFECRERLPALAGWMSDDGLKALQLWHGGRFERGHEYFDLDNPDRGAFVATGDEGTPSAEGVYVCRDNVPEQVWAQLVTWRQPVSARQVEAIEMTVDALEVRPTNRV